MFRFEPMTAVSKSHCYFTLSLLETAEWAWSCAGTGSLLCSRRGLSLPLGPIPQRKGIDKELQEDKRSDYLSS
jgi:hypothetical protein